MQHQIMTQDQRIGIVEQNLVRPHSAHRGQTPASIRLPSCPPASKPAARRFRRWPVARLDPGCARWLWRRRPARRNASRPNRETPSRWAWRQTQGSTSEWRELGAEVSQCTVRSSGPLGWSAARAAVEKLTLPFGWDHARQGDWLMQL
jgi:hypothetical protein